MNQIDIKYHVISIVAVFLSLGVGIFVGSNTNFFNIDAVMKKQDDIINRLEDTHKELQAQIGLERARQKESQDYIAQLENKSIPLLMQGRLRGMSVGIVEVGDFPGGANKDVVVVDVLNRADCVMAFKVRLSLAEIQQIGAGRQGNVYDDLAAEFLLGAAQSSELTTILQTNGAVLAGNFQKPVQGIVFVLGENVDETLASKVLLPLENSVVSHDGAAVNAIVGKSQAYEKLFADSKIPMIENIETITSQAELINRLGARL